MLLKSHVLGDWADGRWSPGFKASLQNILKLCLLFKKIIYIYNIFKYQKCFIFYIFITFIYITYMSEGWRYSSITEYLSSMFKVLVNLSIYNPNVSEKKSQRLTSEG